MVAVDGYHSALLPGPDAPRATDMDEQDHDPSLLGSTVMSIVVGAVAADQALRRKCLERFVSQYGNALRRHILRRRWVPEVDADELLQDFLTDKLLLPSDQRNLAQRYLEKRADHPQLRFRSYLLSALNNYALDRLRKDRRKPVSMEPDFLEEAADGSAEHCQFDLDWATNLLNRAIEDVRADCLRNGQEAIWEVFEARVLQPLRTGEAPPDYETLAQRLRLESVKQASNRLQTAIRKFNRALREAIRNYLPNLSSNPERDIEEELQDLRRIVGQSQGLPLATADAPSDDSSWITRGGSQLFELPPSRELWTSAEDLRQIWSQVVTMNLERLLSEWGLDGQQWMAWYSGRAHRPANLLDVWQDPQPPLPLLQHIKDTARASGLGGAAPVDNGLPVLINALLYLTAICVADLRHATKLSSDPDTTIERRVERLAALDWVDATTLDIFRRWRER